MTESITGGAINYWLQFLFASAVIVFTGIQLSRYGDVIAEKTGIGRAWIGLVLMAGVTSLPELVTGISSVSLVGSVDIALGDIWGSCVYNLLIIALLDALNGRESIFKGVGRVHLVSSAYSIMLLTVGLFSMLFASFVPSLNIFGIVIGLSTPVIVIVYIIGIRAVYYYEKKMVKEVIKESAKSHKREDFYKGLTLNKAVTIYVLNAIVLVGAAGWLPFIADSLSEITGLGESFMGGVFVAMTTSLPEVVVSVAALRIGAQDMAVANMLGSNMFNMAILFVDDIFYFKAPLLSSMSPVHSMTGLIAIMMTVVVLIGLTYRPVGGRGGKHIMALSYYSVMLIALWISSIVVLFFSDSL